jgi:hypothetical protein
MLYRSKKKERSEAEAYNSLFMKILMRLRMRKHCIRTWF